MLKLTLPWPVSVNHYYKSFIAKKTGKVMVVRTPKAVKYIKDAYYCIGKQKTITGLAYMHVIANPPSKQRHDLDNLLKAICDALEYAQVYVNDCQLEQIIIERSDIIKYGKINILISEVKFLVNHNEII